MTFLLLSGTTGLQGCSSKEAASGSSFQQQSPNPPMQDPSSAQQAGAPGGQTSSQAQGQSPVQLPEVSLTADGLDELLAPVALYPDPVLAVLLQASVIPQEVMDGGNWLALDENQNLSGKSKSRPGVSSEAARASRGYRRTEKLAADESGR
jgi:hypothetical protein